MQTELTRRRLLQAAPVLVGVGVASYPILGETLAAEPKDPFGYCLNTSTIRGQKLGIVEVIEIASRAGYTGLEPWLNEIDQYVKDGGSLKDLSKRLQDRGLSVESAIAFPTWIVDDENQRKKGLEDIKRNMDTVQRLGGKRIAAAAAANAPRFAACGGGYRGVLEIGERWALFRN